MKKEFVGGQAVIEGVMMQNKTKRAIAVRKSDGNIELDKKNIKSWVRDKNIDKVPFVRGAFMLIDSMVEGIKSLNFSSQFFLEEEEESKFDEFIRKIFKDKATNVMIYISLFISIIISMGLFVFVPTMVGGIFKSVVDNTIILHLVEGVIRITILLLYLYFISKVEDIKRVFEYHGAEHKTIHCYESGLDLTVENARKFTTLHPRCGTNFLFIVMIISIIVFSFSGWPNLVMRVITRLLCMPIVAGIAYEIIRFFGKFDNITTKIFSYPGLMLQKITTREPDDRQLEVAITALRAVLDIEVRSDDDKRCDFTVH